MDAKSILASAVGYLTVEFIATDTLRLALPAQCPRIYSRLFNRALLGFQKLKGIKLSVLETDEPGSEQAIATAWSLPLKSLHEVQVWAATHGDTTRLALPDWLEDLTKPDEEEEARVCPAFFSEPGAAELLPYQREGVAFGVRRHGRLLLADDMGLGKTLQAIGILHQYAPEGPVLVIAPSSLRGVWEQQLKRWAGVDADRVQVVYEGKTTIQPTAEWVVVSYALLAGAPALRRTARGEPYKVVVCDECHYVKNPEAKRSRAVYEVAKAATRLVLISGTPVLNTAMELFPLLRLLDPRMPEEGTFARRYFKTQNTDFGKNKWVSPQRELELHTYLFHKIGIRRKKEDVLHQLPPKRRQSILLRASACGTSQQELHELEEKLFASGAQEEDIDRFQVERALGLVMKTKIRCCCEYVRDLIDSGCGKFLLFAHHRVMMDALEISLKERLGGGYIRIDGSTPQKQRPDLVEQFQGDVDCHVALLSITAVAEGLTLTAAEAVVFAELVWTPGLILQCEGRAHRIGQKGSVLVQYLLLDDSQTDARCYKMLEEKHRHAGMVLDGGVAGLWQEQMALEEGKMTACRSSRQKPATAFGAHPKSRASPGVVFGDAEPTEVAGGTPAAPDVAAAASGLQPKSRASPGRVFGAAELAEVAGDTPAAPGGPAEATPGRQAQAEAKAKPKAKAKAKAKRVRPRKAENPQPAAGDGGSGGGSESYTVAMPLHLGLKINVGRSYTKEDLEARCKGDEQKLARLSFYISDGVRLKPTVAPTPSALSPPQPKRKRRKR